MMNSDNEMISKKRPKMDHPTTTSTVVRSDTNGDDVVPTTNHHQSRLKLIKVFGHLLSNEFLNDDNDDMSTTTGTNHNTTATATSATTTSNNNKRSNTQFYKEPYPYGMITSFLSSKFLLQVLNEIKQNSKVKYKESDLYKVYQSIDLANLNATNNNNNTDDPSTTTTTTMPSVLQLRDLLYSIEFRYYMEDLNQLPRNTLIHNNSNNKDNHTTTTTTNPNQEDTSEENTLLPSQSSPLQQLQQIDCACNCHMTTCHLLCHDDVIGTRKISYILYLTEPNPIWTHEEGGALELYNSYETTTTTNTTTTLRIPHTVPCQSILPIFNSLVYFVVRPGYSYHSVQEVFGQRPRLSIQGWYHTAATADATAAVTATTTNNNISTTTSTSTTTSKQYSTLQRLKTYNHKNHLDAKEEDTEGPFIPIVATTTNDTTTNVEPSSLPLLLLSESDRHTLQPFICDTYLTEDAIRSIRKRFANDSSIQLRHFLKDTYVQPVNTLIQNEGNPMIQLKKDHDNNMDDADRISSFYHWGVTEEWKLIGPPHKQRFLEYQPPSNEIISTIPISDDNNDTKPPAAQPTILGSTKDLHTMGSYLHYIRYHLFQSKAFYNYLSAITHLDSSPIGYRGRIRRFRPGRDYTVAHYGLLTERSVLDATLCFVKEIDDKPTTTNIDDDDDGEQMNDAARAITQDETAVDGDTEEPIVPEFSEAMELWQSGECGGFECYIEADDDDDDETGAATSGPADEYNPEDDTELLNVSASNNTLSLVYRDPGTMRFIKYVSATAPSSRYDIAMEYDFPEIANDDDEEEEEEEDEEDGIDNDDTYEP